MNDSTEPLGYRARNGMPKMPTMTRCYCIQSGDIAKEGLSGRSAT
jgi:hypothetical protein